MQFRHLKRQLCCRQYLMQIACYYKMSSALNFSRSLLSLPSVSGNFFGINLIFSCYSMTCFHLNFRSFALNILPESWLSIIHHVNRSMRRHATWWTIVMLSSFVFCWVEKSSGRCILTQRKVCHVHVLILTFVFHHNKTVNLLCSIHRSFHQLAQLLRLHPLNHLCLKTFLFYSICLACTMCKRDYQLWIYDIH